MASKEQYEFFRLLYEEEERRYGQLEGRAKLYLSVITLFLAAVLFKASEVRSSAAVLGIPWPVVAMEAAMLVGALLLVILGVLIRSYEGIADAGEIIEHLGDSPPSNDEFFDDRIVDFAAASIRNARVNDRSARYLAGAAILLAGSMAVLVVVLGLSFRH
jgi:hypothetical protein